MTQKAKSRQELAQEYGVSPKTLSRWIKKNGLQFPNGLLTPREQELIYDKFGKPRHLLEQER